MLKKTIIAAALVSSALVASQASATALKNLKNVNTTTKYWLAIGNPTTGNCSTVLPNGEGVVGPNKSVTSTLLQIKLVCGFSYPCTTSIYAFAQAPKASEKCTDGTSIATSTLKDLSTGQVTFSSVASGWHVSPGNTVPDSNGLVTETVSKTA